MGRLVVFGDPCHNAIARAITRIFYASKNPVGCLALQCSTVLETVAHGDPCPAKRRGASTPATRTATYMIALRESGEDVILLF